jgi:hypothetical protein
MLPVARIESSQKRISDNDVEDIASKRRLHRIDANAICSLISEFPVLAICE